MIFRSAEIPVEERSDERNGSVKRLIGSEQMHEKNRLFAHVVLKPGAQVSYHRHQGEFEVFYFLSGTGEVNDNGAESLIQAGDVMFTDAGQSHAIKNTGIKDMEYMALITRL
jgi:mannose-6-phosphate isomerase-like protein (cupin superfamily)